MENFSVKRNQSSVGEFVKVGGEVEHEVGRALVGHRVCHSEGERLHLQSESERETGKEVALVGRHVGTRLVVVPESHVEFLVAVLQAEDQMAEQVAHEAVLQFYLLAVFLVVVVGHLPPHEVGCRYAQAEG